MIASGSGSQLPRLLAADRAARRATRSSAANRRLAHALGADPASADAARILRVPATLSHKHDPPTPVEAIRLDTDRRVTRPT